MTVTSQAKTFLKFAIFAQNDRWPFVCRALAVRTDWASIRTARATHSKQSLLSAADFTFTVRELVARLFRIAALKIVLSIITAALRAVAIYSHRLKVAGLSYSEVAPRK